MTAWPIFSAMAAIVAFLLGLAIGAHCHFFGCNKRSWDDRGQPTYDKDGKLTGWIK